MTEEEIVRKSNATTVLFREKLLTDVMSALVTLAVDRGAEGHPAVTEARRILKIHYDNRMDLSAQIAELGDLHADIEKLVEKYARGGKTK